MNLFVTLSRKYRIRDYYIKLVFCVIALAVIGILVIGSANKNFQTKQIMGLVMGVFVMTFVSLFDYSYILRFYWVIYGINILFLLTVIFFGSDAGGATRWIDLKVFTFQPSELSKILMILFLSQYLGNLKEAEKLNDPKEIVKLMVLILFPVFLIYKQPDLSTSIVVFLVCFVMYFVAGLSGKLVALLMAIGIPLIAVFFHMIIQGKIIGYYQWLRIMAWLHPEDYPQSAYQQQNSITAIGSGQLFGKGLYNTDVDSVKNGNFISEPQTDFIFAVTGEEMGFIGCCTIIVLLLLVSLMCIYLGSKAKDFKGKLICNGMAALVSIQSFFNICVVTGLLPNTGLPLPFVSYGLTSLISLFIGIGVVLNVGLQRINY